MSRHIVVWLAFVCLAFAAGTLSGCFTDYSCTEIGCEGNLQCNASTGKCEALVRSCQPGSCPSGTVCNESTGICQSAGARCVDDSCPARQVCNAQTGFCEARSNCELDPCASAAEECDTLTGQCVPRSCADDSECPFSFYCAASGVCRSGCRVDEADACPDGEFCRAAVGEPIGQCREQCHADDDCPLGQQCEQTRDGSSCELEPPCAEDEDCRGQAVCRQNRCQPPPCTANADCAGDEVCDLATGTCVGGNCEEDIHAPNQTPDEAAELDPGSFAQLRLCPGKADWFSLRMRSSDAFELRLEHAPSADLDIFVWGPNGYLLAANQQTGPVTTLEVNSQVTQQVAVQIVGLDLDEETYDLEVTRNPDALFCRDDTSEENDHPGQPVVLPTDTSAPFEASLSVCGADEDWFVLPELQRDQGLVVARSEVTSQLVVELLTPDGYTYALAPPSAIEPDEIRLERLGAEGDYLLRVRDWLSRAGTYRLRTQVLAPFDCPDATAHNTAETAVQVPINAVQLYSFCPLEQAWEIDWLALTPAQQDGTLTAQVVAVGDLPDLDVVVFEQTVDGLERVRSAARTDQYYQVRLPVEAGESYLFRISANGVPGRIVDGVNYQVFYRYESSD
ncbi:hypothetical protein FIV42_29670 [Persicimonas caeni]|uniref:Dickkopf N-terminal cysteine-rich domain-containing protein n=1 Tax=Persicimonas caeni TaxID=2292766 RepID=A0A4Y6Q451_PERCE|nr:hypothetical protein [Persicimonas caeni]QDG54765.1 hypothetical protein FIV42_29670 [Persicimonas caeni]QED35986.1 hypothetical protein FRD00_29665 [Persicimonas caeni]